MHARHWMKTLFPMVFGLHQTHHITIVNTPLPRIISSMSQSSKQVHKFGVALLSLKKGVLSWCLINRPVLSVRFLHQSTRIEKETRRLWIDKSLYSLVIIKLPNDIPSQGRPPDRKSWVYASRKTSFGNNISKICNALANQKLASIYARSNSVLCFLSRFR